MTDKSPDVEQLEEPAQPEPDDAEPETSLAEDHVQHPGKLSPALLGSSHFDLNPAFGVE